MEYLVRECFHAVGNGTLFTGQIKEIEGSGVFNWVYDCGSTSKRTICNTLNNLPNWFGSTSQPIDMLVISHFDDDHVNGLEVLLRTYNVKKLVFPFTEWAQSIREISIGGQKGVSPSVALLQLNPAKWLEVNGLENRIDEILFVQGEGYSDEVTAGSAFFEFGDSVNSLIKIDKIHHNQQENTSSGSFEFMFYNAVKPFSVLGLIYESDGQTYAKRSKMPMPDVKAEIEKIVMSLNLHKDINKLPANWRKTLKGCYEKHFGNSSYAKNNISLCMYAAPSIKSCLEAVTSRKPLTLATLFTGDINLTAAVISDMEAHFGEKCWSSLGMVQIPHHGSKNSWPQGNAIRFNNAQFVQCATPTKINHPHKDVTEDLDRNSKKVHHANRKTSVCWCYRYNDISQQKQLLLDMQAGPTTSASILQMILATK
ncbi:hypothetical protein [Leminorella grimontii]|uniref:hypothetical protein n=1 Tax=Leminorella grimontii TaxID=82981 RepID=UPI00208861F6|nr:hypothetical protein [Leminorella grimontii]GKX58079.1 hypothetical protein SOASR031_03940 [Leminorella grimontii]